ncbi:MAG: long-chain-fatty-acid--CoA ligase [Deferribacteraceae bacterium]|jgi:long-chain acyl-CoA synthetase|nr:long-chain-fatty-acid--CoA ligase [Deferribacteraceae bacterium]
MYYRKMSELITNNAKYYPTKECIFFKDKVYTYADVDKQVRHTAAILQDNGIKKGDRVMILLENSPEFVFAYFGVLMLGAVAAPTNVFLRDREIAAHMNDCSAERIITSETFAERVKQLPQLVDNLKTVFTFEKASFSSIIFNETSAKTDATEPAINEHDLALILYTSGTTGRPKGVMLSHYNLLENAKSHSSFLEEMHDDRMLLVLPMFHATSMMASLLGPLVKGASIIILESILEVSKSYYPEMLKTLKPTLLVGVPALYAAMARVKVSEQAKADFPFRVCLSGGAPLPVEIIDRFHEVYGVGIVEGYGLSEASPICAINPLSRQKYGTIGVHLAGVDVRVVDEFDNDLPLNTPGELIVKGPNVMSGYWNQPEESAKALKNGWLHTGDVATIDEDEFITIVDRIKDLILVKGMNVYPREIEELLYKYTGVLSAAVVGVPDGEGSEIPIAYLKADPEAHISVDELKEYIRHNVASYKVPRRFVITDDIPVNAGGKVIKKELKERAAREFA